APGAARSGHAVRRSGRRLVAEGLRGVLPRERGRVRQRLVQGLLVLLGEGDRAVEGCLLDRSRRDLRRAGELALDAALGEADLTLLEMDQPDGRVLGEGEQ